MNIIRPAQKEDAPQLLRIYSPYILHSGITQETEVPSVDEFQQRITNTLTERPWLICEIDQQMAGYAYAGRHRERKGYQWCVETSVYVHPAFFRRGVATALYLALIDILTMQGFVNVYAVITLPNDKSVAFHEHLGFRYLTTFKKIGYKLGRWHDVGWWELQINPRMMVPENPIKFSDLDTGSVHAILENISKKIS